MSAPANAVDEHFPSFAIAGLLARNVRLVHSEHGRNFPHLDAEPGHITLYSFSDGEHYVQIDENVRGADVFIIQPTCPPSVNDHLMELLIMLDAFKRSSAKRVTAVSFPPRSRLCHCQWAGVDTTAAASVQSEP